MLIMSLTLSTPTEKDKRIFATQFFNTALKASPLEDYTVALPTRTSAFSNRRNAPTSPYPVSTSQPDESVPLSPFNLQFAEADPFKGGRPLNLIGSYDPHSQQWLFADGGTSAWNWIGGYDTVVCSRDVVVSQVSREWCSAGGSLDVQWDEWLEDVVQHDEDVP